MRLSSTRTGMSSALPMGASATVREMARWATCASQSPA